MYDVIFCESQGKPSTMFAYQYFNNDAQSAASSKGMPVIRVAYETIVSECTDLEEIEAGVSGAMDRVVAALTQPLTAEEKAPRSKEPEKLERLVFKGNLEEINRFFYKRGWSDGLPIIPPTEDAVAEMLKGSDLAPEHVVATLVPRRGKATVEKIAVNAVMAGALPSHLPVLIAGTRALLTNRGADMMAASTGSWAPFWLINGPVRKDLNINSSYGAMNPGDIANAAIGRAMGLITKNIRGIRKGIEDMGVLGNPGKYSMVAAEDEENNPWEPFHVEQGLKKEDSAISLTFPQTYLQLYPYGTDDKGLLATLIYNIQPIRQGIMNVILTPTNARSLAKRGWSKKEIKKFVLENARVPWYRHPRSWSTVLTGEFTTQERRQNLNAADSVRIIEDDPRAAEPIQIFVFGGMGSWVGITHGGPVSNTEKIELPSAWAKLVQKYRDVVPAYFRY